MNLLRRHGGLVLGLVILTLAVGLSLLPSGSSDAAGSVVSAMPSGRRAVFLVLQELALPVRAWRSAPGELEPGGLLWPAAPPEAPEGIRDLIGRELAPAAASAVVVHDPAHYRRFVAEGGTLLFGVGDQDRIAFVEELLGAELPEGTGDRFPVPDDATFVLAHTGEEVAPPELFVWEAETWSTRDDAVLEGVVREPDGSVSPALVRLPVGRGSLLLFADDRFVENDDLRTGDAALLVARVVERFADGRPVLFDEYALGSWESPSKASIAVSPRLLPVSANALLLTLLWVLARGRRRSYPRDPVPPHPLSALARVRAEAGFLLRSQRSALIAERLRDGVLAELGRATRTRAADRELPPETRLRELLRTRDEDEVKRWKQALGTKGVTGPSDLRAYAARLDELVARVLPPAERDGLRGDLRDPARAARAGRSTLVRSEP